MRPGKALAALMVVGVMGIATMAACAQGDTPPPTPPTPVEISSTIEPQTMRIEYPPGLTGRQYGLWASGQGQVKAEPDLALLEVGVRAMEATVAEANAEAAHALTAMIETLNGAGIEDSDIQTSALNIRQERDSRPVTRCPAMSSGKEGEATPVAEPAGPDGPAASVMEPAILMTGSDFGMMSQDECYTTYEQVVTGYVVWQELTTRIRELDSVGDLVDQLVEAGGDLTRINGINFIIEEPAPVMEQARRLAIEDMLSRAEHMAEAAGVELGALEYVSESGARVLDVREETFFQSAAPAAMAMDATSVNTPISAGELTVTASVTGAFAIGGDGEQ